MQNNNNIPLKIFLWADTRRSIDVPLVIFTIETLDILFTSFKLKTPTQQTLAWRQLHQLQETTTGQMQTQVS